MTVMYRAMLESLNHFINVNADELRFFSNLLLIVANAVVWSGVFFERKKFSVKVQEHGARALLIGLALETFAGIALWQIDTAIINQQGLTIKDIRSEADTAKTNADKALTDAKDAQGKLHGLEVRQHKIDVRIGITEGSLQGHLSLILKGALVTALSGIPRVPISVMVSPRASDGEAMRGILRAGLSGLEEVNDARDNGRPYEGGIVVEYHRDRARPMKGQLEADPDSKKTAELICRALVRNAGVPARVRWNDVVNKETPEKGVVIRVGENSISYGMPGSEDRWVLGMEKYGVTNLRCMDE